MGVGIDDRADKCCVWADLRALADHGLAFQEASGKDHRIAFDTHVIFDPRGFRVENVTPLRIQCSQIRLL